jgi:hypothetical protein
MGLVLDCRPLFGPWEVLEMKESCMSILAFEFDRSQYAPTKVVYNFGDAGESTKLPDDHNS